MELPKYHKASCKRNWLIRGVKLDNFEIIYTKYITTENCEDCGVKFLKSKEKRLDHDHETGEVRNILCNKCNLKSHRTKLNSRNTTGEKHIYSTKYTWKGIEKNLYRFTYNGKVIKSSTNLDELISFKNNYILVNHNVLL